MNKNLIIYYSRRGQNYLSGDIVDLEVGNAERIVDYMTEAIDADVFEIETVKPYPEDYTQCTEVAKREIHENARPKLKSYLRNLDHYENVFIVGPCWWGTFPMPVFSQIEKLNFSGKKVFAVITHEGSGLGAAEKDLKKMCRGAKVGRGIAIQGSKVPEAQKFVMDWVKKCTSKWGFYK